MQIEERLKETIHLLYLLGLPRQQQNERSALCLLSLLDLKPEVPWDKCQSPLMGITPIMDWSRDNYGKEYAPNTRETFRRQSMHQFVQAGIALYNPDKPDRPVNSPHAVYQIEPQVLALIKSYTTKAFDANLQTFKQTQQTLIEKYAKEREMHLIPVQLGYECQINLSAGLHSILIKQIVEEFGSRYTPGGKLIYVGDTGDKYGYFDNKYLKTLGITLDNHGKMPDVVIHFTEKNWLILIESVTSHGPIDSKRHKELNELFTSSTAGVVYVSAFPDRKTFLKYLEYIAWETEVWVADAPTHMIHFNGSRFLGPY